MPLLAQMSLRHLLTNQHILQLSSELTDTLRLIGSHVTFLFKRVRDESPSSEYGHLIGRILYDHGY